MDAINSCACDVIIRLLKRPSISAAQHSSLLTEDMDAVLKLIHGRHRRRALPDGTILLEDCKKVCENVQCTAGAVVKVSERVGCLEEGV